MELGKPNNSVFGRIAAGLLVPALCTAGLLAAACGSSGSGTAQASQTSAQTKACQEVSAVLSDGPDPGADPVGYALAQVRPLRQIHTPDVTLQTEIDALAAAYEQFYKAGGTGPATSSLNREVNRMNDTICPGAGASL